MKPVPVREFICSVVITLAATEYSAQANRLSGSHFYNLTHRSENLPVKLIRYSDWAGPVKTLQ